MTETSESTEKTEKTKGDAEERLTTAELVERADEFGLDPVALTGALTGHSRKTHSVSQAKDETRKFLRRKVGA